MVAVINVDVYLFLVFTEMLMLMFMVFFGFSKRN